VGRVQRVIPLVLRSRQSAAFRGLNFVIACCELAPIRHQRLVGVAALGLFVPDVKGVYAKQDLRLRRGSSHVVFSRML